jgi:hypothetical protein
MAYRGLRTLISGGGLAVAVCFTTVALGRQGTSPDLDPMAFAVLHLRPIGLPVSRWPTRHRPRPRFRAT